MKKTKQLSGRTRNSNGQIRQKSGSTKVSTIEKKYNVDLGVRGDMKLSTLLKRQGYPSASKLLEMVDKSKVSK